MRIATCAALAAAVLSAGSFTAGRAMAQAGGDPPSTTDPFNGAAVNDALSSDPVNCCGLTGAPVDFPLENMFGGTTSGNGNTFDAAIFNDSVNVANPAVVVFTRGNSTPIFGVNVFTSSDDPANPEVAARSTSDFMLAADADNNGSFETVLVASGNPLDNGSSNFFPFAGSSTATTFQATFTPGNVTGCCNGPRVIELDAVTVPEPAAIGLLALGGLGALTRRRRRRA